SGGRPCELRHGAPGEEDALGATLARAARLQLRAAVGRGAADAAARVAGPHRRRVATDSWRSSAWLLPDTPPLSTARRPRLPHRRCPGRRRATRRLSHLAPRRRRLLLTGPDPTAARRAQCHHGISLD